MEPEPPEARRVRSSRQRHTSLKRKVFHGSASKCSRRCGLWSVSWGHFRRSGVRKMARRVPFIPVAAAALCVGVVTLSPSVAVAASSASCDGGGFSLLGLSGDQRTVVGASSVGSTFVVKGKYVEFTVESDTFGI